MFELIFNLKNRASNFFSHLGRIGYFVRRILYTIFTSVPDGKSIVAQMFRIGIETFPVIAAVCIFIGTNIALVGFEIFKEFGGQNMLGVYVGLSCLREMAPILVGAIMAAKPGTDIAATIATMRIKEQIDALEVMAVNPIWFLIVPRFIAFILVAPILVIFADFFSMAAGFCVSVFQLGINPGKFLNDLGAYIQFQDFFFSMIKGIVFAIMTCIFSSYFGYHSEPGPKGVSSAINKSIVSISSLIVVVDYFLTEIMYGIK